MLAMADKSKKIRDHKLGTLSGACRGNGLANHPEAVDQVIAHRATSHNPVSRCACREIRAGKLTVIGSGVGKLIVGDHDDQREFLHGSHVQSLVKTSRRSPSLADAGGTDHAALSAETPRHKSAADRGDHGPEMADHRVISLGGTPPVDVPVATAHGPQNRAEVGAEGVENRVSEREATSLVADQRRVDVTPTQVKAKRHAKSLLTTPQKDTTDDFSRAVKRRKFLLQQTCLKHRAVALAGKFAGHARAVTGSSVRGAFG